MRVVLCIPADDGAPWIDLFRAAMPDAQIALRDVTAAGDADTPQADYAVTAGRCETLFDEQCHLKAVFALSAGAGHLLALPNLPRDMPLYRLEDAGMAAQMIRYVLSAALRFAQRMDTYARQQRDARWEQHPPRDPATIAIGVMGLGVIGAQIAGELAAHGFSVRGYTRSPRTVDAIQVFAGSAQFSAFLSGVDFLVNVLPNTPGTRGVLNRSTLARLTDGAHVLNIGRGAALVEEDLLMLLDSGKLSGATLDVFNEEPLPAHHPFWRRPEILVTPHISGLTLPSAAVAQVAGKIAQLERGEPVSGIVDFERGY
jgi:glyoxylate/hydroxypyruvate reductase A